MRHTPRTWVEVGTEVLGVPPPAEPPEVRKHSFAAKLAREDLARHLAEERAWRAAARVKRKRVDEATVLAELEAKLESLMKESREGSA